MEIHGKIQEISKLLYHTTELSISFLSMDGSNLSLYEHSDPIMKEISSHVKINNLFRKTSNAHVPMIQTILHQNYIGIPMTAETGMEGILILGPSIYSPLQDHNEEFLSFITTIEEKNHVISYYKQLPILSFAKLNHTAALAYYMIYGKSIGMEEIMEHNFLHTQTIDSAWGIFNESFSIARQVDQVYSSYIIEKQIFESIRKGDTKALMTFLTKQLEAEDGIFSVNDTIRSSKNMVIGYAAIGCRLALEAGVFSELMYRKNDIYIQMIEEATTMDAIQSLMITILCDYCNMVKNWKENNHSNLVNSCIDYIYMHLFEDITVKEMALTLNFNESYLSRSFKKEYGITISEFIMREKVEEAKRLLVFTDFTIIYIAVILHFHDQSHFTRVFKKVTGVTPKKYRGQYMK